MLVSGMQYSDSTVPYSTQCSSRQVHSFLFILDDPLLSHLLTDFINGLFSQSYVFISWFYLFSLKVNSTPNIPSNLLLLRLSMTFLLQDSVNAFFLLEVLSFLGFTKPLSFAFSSIAYPIFFFWLILLNRIFSCWNP